MPPVEWMLFVAAIAVVAGLFRGFTGFGSGLLMAPVMTLVIEPSIAVPTMLLIALGASARLVPEVWGNWDRRRIMMLAIPAMIAIPFGEVLLVSLDAALMQKLIAFVVLGLVAILASGWRFRGELRWPVVVPAGLVSGVLSGMGGVGGPPVVLLNMADSDADRARANLIGFFVISQMTALIGFAIGGVYRSETFWYAGTAVLPFVVAIHLGARRFKPERAVAWRRLSLVVLAATGLIGLIAQPLH